MPHCPPLPHCVWLARPRGYRRGSGLHGLPKRQTRRKAGTQSHGSGYSLDSRVTELNQGALRMRYSNLIAEHIALIRSMLEEFYNTGN